KKEQEMLLRQSVSELDQLDRSIESIVQAWLKGDAGALEPLLLESMKEYPDIYQKLIVGRNRRWVSQIEEMLEQRGATMVVVGAAHLLGKDGVVAMLKERGYKVEQE
ncbi:MAG TPA: TraB/GumN family protein, partial [Methylomirabilota bacterium]|nr:TraB/GumN family protein [Methylomirabilota bacterium]